ncbi:DUF6153 family protein [Paeniglutamicibacter sp. NPDC012692]|uniref:DUF6153 family protein n=1 Tax=Paeniglutamicibacter sp. NPDC012692 TaxID=3364388 RepID=UPI0036823CEB
MKKSFRPVNRRALSPAIQVVVLCAFFLGLLSMHVLTGAAFGPVHHGETRSAAVTEASLAASAHDHGEQHMQASEPDGDHGIGLGECALLVACVLGLVVFAHKLGRPGIGGTAPRAGPTPYRPRLIAFSAGIFQPPSPQQLSICRR